MGHWCDRQVCDKKATRTYGDWVLCWDHYDEAVEQFGELHHV